MSITSRLNKVNIPDSPPRKPRMRLQSGSPLVKWLRNHETDDYKRKRKDYFEDYEEFPGQYKLSYSPGGKLVELKNVLGHKPRELSEIKRNIIDGYSRQARNRFMKLLFSIDYGKMELPLFYTLTYPAEYSNDPDQWKRDLNTFIKRLERLHPELCGIWRLEPQIREAPHFSGFLWGCNELSTMEGKKLFSKMWFEVVGSGDEKHLRAGTGIQKIDKVEGLIYYLSKYISKSEKGGKPQEFDYPVGRYWGAFKRDRLAISKEEFEIDRNMFFKIRRVIKKYLEKRLRKNTYRKIMAENKNGLWAIISNETILKLMNLIIQNEESEAKYEDQRQRVVVGYR